MIGSASITLNPAVAKGVRGQSKYRRVIREMRRTGIQDIQVYQDLATNLKRLDSMVIAELVAVMAEDRGLLTTEDGRTLMLEGFV